MVVIPFPEPPPVLTLEAMEGLGLTPALEWRLPRNPDFALLNEATRIVLNMTETLAFDRIRTAEIDGNADAMKEACLRLIELMSARIAEINRLVDEERIRDPVTPRKHLYERFALMADAAGAAGAESSPIDLAKPELPVDFPRRAKPVSFNGSIKRLWNRLRYPRLTRIWGPMP